MSASRGWKWLATLKKLLWGAVDSESAQPNKAAAALLKDKAFQRRALSPGTEHHQVYTNGEFVYDPIYKNSPIPRAEYEAQLRELNGPTVEIGFWKAPSSEDMP